MRLNLLDFQDKYLCSLTACASETFSEREPPLEWPDPIKNAALHATYDILGDDSATARLIVERDVSSFSHFHIDVTRAGEDAAGPDLKQTSIESFHDWLSRFEKMNVCVFILARYRIPITDLPHRGIVSNLLGITTKSCGARMSLTGTTMEIEDDLFTQLSWQVDDETGDAIKVKLEAESVSIFDENYLVNLAKVMREGLDCFVFESPTEKIGHEEQSQKPLQPKKLGTG